MASGGDIRAGKAFVELYVKNSQLLKGLAAAKQRLQDFGNGMATIGKTMMGFGGALLAPIALATKHFMSAGDQIDKMAARTGVSTNALSELGFAAEQSGASIEAVETSLKKMQKGIADAATGSKSQADAFGQLGLAVSDLMGKSPDEQFALIADRLSQISDPTMRAAAAMDVFGKSGTDLLPLMEGGAAGIAALRKEAVELGRSIGPEQAKSAAALADAWNRVKSSMSAVLREIGSIIAPIITQALESIKGILKSSRDWIAANTQLVVGIAKVGAGLVGFGVAAVILGKVVGGVGALIGVIRSLGVAMVVLSANPLGTSLLAVAVALTAITTASRAASRALDANIAAAQRMAESGDKLRQRHSDALARLEALTAQERLNNDEMEEAENLIRILTDYYGDLGIELDKTTGKLTGVAAAHKRVADAMRNMKVTELTFQIRELKAKQDALLATYNKTSKTMFAQASENILGEAEDLGRQILALQQLLDSLKAGGQVMPAPSAGAAQPGSGAGLGLTDEAANLRELHRMKLGMIENEKARALALIDEEYQHRIAKAKEAGQATAAIEEMHQLARSQIQREAVDKMIAERERAEQETADRRAQIDAQIADDAERVHIESTMRGAAKEQALLAVRHRKEIEEAQAAGANVELLMRKQATERGLLGAREVMQSITKGTFSASAVGGMGTGNVQERIAKATERMEKQSSESTKLLEEIRRGIGRLNLEATP